LPNGGNAETQKAETLKRGWTEKLNRRNRGTPEEGRTVPGQQAIGFVLALIGFVLPPAFFSLILILQRFTMITFGFVWYGRFFPRGSPRGSAAGTHLLPQ